MTKAQFDVLLATTNKLQAENRKQIGQNVLDAVPLFKGLTVINKKKLVEAMIPMTYMPGSYICRQGTTGNTFFILTEGTCKVTINGSESNEKEVAKLHPGDFFGEVALIESSNRRTANVISVDSVSCLTLSRNDFNRLLKNLKVKLLEHQAIRSNNEQQDTQTSIKQATTLASKRRISGYNTIGQRDEVRISTLLRRLCTFMTESLWNSLYSRMYRDVLLDSSKLTEYGKVVQQLMKSSSTETRFETVTNIAEAAGRILESDPARRTQAEHAFVLGLLKQRNHLKDRLCRSWPPHQFALLARKVKFAKFRYLRKIIEVDTKGTTAFLILRGCVRIFSRIQRGDGHTGNPNAAYAKTFYEEDLFPGDVFGEAALAGMHTRMLTALSMTNVELAVIDDQDFMTSQDRDSQHMGTEEKSRFLSQVPMFRLWDNYKLLRLAHVLVQEEIDAHTLLTSHGGVCKDLYFLVSGKIDILDSLRKRNVITSLQPHDYFGETGFCNRFVKAISSKVQEEFFAVATTKLEVLVLQEQNFPLFDMSSIDSVRSAFLAKQSWRRERVQIMKHERARVRKEYARMKIQAGYLPYLRRQEAKEQERRRRLLRLQQGLGEDSEEDDSDDEEDAVGGTSPGGVPQLPPAQLQRPRTAPAFPQRAMSHDPLTEDEEYAQTSQTMVALGDYGGLGMSRGASMPGSPTAPANQKKAAAGDNFAASATTGTSEHKASEDRPRPKSAGPLSNTSPSTKTKVKEPVVVAKADIAYQIALVHPLDTRLQASNAALWRPPLQPKDRVEHLEDIPALLNKDFDLLMVTAACRDVREAHRSRDLILQAKRPLTAMARVQKDLTIDMTLPAQNNLTNNLYARTSSSSHHNTPAPSPTHYNTSKRPVDTMHVSASQIMSEHTQSSLDPRFHQTAKPNPTSQRKKPPSATHKTHASHHHPGEQAFEDLAEPEPDLVGEDARAYQRQRAKQLAKEDVAKRFSGNSFRTSFANLLAPVTSGTGDLSPATHAVGLKVTKRPMSATTPFMQREDEQEGERRRRMMGTDTDENDEDEEVVPLFIHSLQPLLPQTNTAAEDRLFLSASQSQLPLQRVGSAVHRGSTVRKKSLASTAQRKTSQANVMTTSTTSTINAPVPGNAKASGLEITNQRGYILPPSPVPASHSQPQMMHMRSARPSSTLGRRQSNSNHHMMQRTNTSGNRNNVGLPMSQQQLLFAQNSALNMSLDDSVDPHHAVHMPHAHAQPGSPHATAGSGAGSGSGAVPPRIVTGPLVNTRSRR